MVRGLRSKTREQSEKVTCYQQFDTYVNWIFLLNTTHETKLRFLQMKHDLTSHKN